MSMAKEFREFAVKGNVMDLAVGVIIGAAFGKIVDSIVNDLIMPVVGLFLGGLDFNSWVIPLRDVPAGVARTYVELKKAGVAFIAPGNFLSIVLNFVILAFIVFMLVKFVNRLRREEEKPTAPAAPKEEVVLLREIRDAVRAQ
jgi:large conductance mechanosensitive channel